VLFELLHQNRDVVGEHDSVETLLGHPNNDEEQKQELEREGILIFRKFIVQNWRLAVTFCRNVALKHHWEE